MNRSHISEAKFRQILKCFALDITATDTAELALIDRKTVNRIFNKIRKHITSLSGTEEADKGEFEVDESYFGAKRVRGKRGRGAAGKTPVFGLLKRGGKVHVSIVKNCSKEALMPIITGKVLEGSTIHSDGWGAYDGLILNGYDHYRVFHSNNEFARGKCHINGIESFWSYAKRRLAKFNGCAGHKFFLHLKESEYRFNNRNENIYSSLLKSIRSKPL